jgi:hypothetical protein
MDKTTVELQNQIGIILNFDSNKTVGSQKPNWDHSISIDQAGLQKQNPLGDPHDHQGRKEQQTIT